MHVDYYVVYSQRLFGAQLLVMIAMVMYVLWIEYHHLLLVVVAVPPPPPYHRVPRPPYSGDDRTTTRWLEVFVYHNVRHGA
jgi:hypothetical protein